MQLRFRDIRLIGLGTTLPSTEVTSIDIEERLRPTYERLGLVQGRLELMTGIRARRHFPKNTLPSEVASLAAEDLFRRLPERRAEVDCLIYASVCRDCIEPASSVMVHHRLGLSPKCLTFDLSNACLSFMNAIVVASGLLDSSIARCALIVSGEDATSVVDSTITSLNADLTLTRQTLKPSIASLTLGSGGVAALLVQGTAGAQILGGAFSTASEFHSLCRGGESAADTHSSIQMVTDSEAMLEEGVRLAAHTWRETKEALRWDTNTATSIVTHQVGSAHRRLLFETLELDPERDRATFETLGNTGAASIGLTLAAAARKAQFANEEKIALLGIGSGLVSGMLGLQWSTEVSV